MNEKRKVNLRAWLIGKGMFDAVRALELCIAFHPELRKDGVTPYYMHPITVAQYLRTVGGDDLYEKNLESILIVGLCHDTCEDFSPTQDGKKIETLPKRLRNFFLCRKQEFETLQKLNKHNYATKEDWYADIPLDPIAAIVKGADRVNNLETMEGVFTPEKQKSYIAETEDLILPMLKWARRNHPEYDNAFENLKLVLVTQTTLLRRVLEARGFGG